MEIGLRTVDLKVEKEILATRAMHDVACAKSSLRNASLGGHCLRSKLESNSDGCWTVFPRFA